MRLIRGTSYRGRFVCIGCARRPTRERHTYCRLCRKRLAEGYQALDVDDLPTQREARRWRHEDPDPLRGNAILANGA